MSVPSRQFVLHFVVVVLCGTLCGQETHVHEHGGEKKRVKPPRIFLDKSLRIVQYQLNRLDNERLLLVERKTDHPKYAPVYIAILTREGMSPHHREEALAALVKLRGSSAAAELLKALGGLRPRDAATRVPGQLASLLLRQPAEKLVARRANLVQATGAKSAQLRAAGYAGLVVAGKSTLAWSTAQRSESAKLDWLAAVALLPKPELRAPLRGQIVGLLAESHGTEIRRAAIRALSSVVSQPTDTFQRVAALATQAPLRAAAVRTLLKVPATARDAETSRGLVEHLVEYAEKTPAKDRTTGEFVDAMQLADQLLARIPIAAARSCRARLRAVSVRVVRILTVAEEMRYDTPYFAVEAGRPVQVVLQNEDLMPHNLVVTVPGALQEVAELGLAAGPAGHGGKSYVPDSKKVLHATRMVQPGQEERLTFTAPAEPGEYPYVCTFPRHWMRMYGVMTVVEDLDAWLQSPTKPKDPIGSDRAFVKAWKFEDFKDLDAGLRGRSPEIGARLFVEASCAQCHKMRGEGVAVGPELTDVLKRWKGDRRAVLREILEPSHRIDPKYAMRVIVTATGTVVSGIVTSEDKTAVSILDNPEAKKPTVVRRSDIVKMEKTAKSMMPKALLERFTRDEVLELLAFLVAGGVGAPTDDK